MTTNAINEVIDAFSQLPLEEKEYAVDIIKKQLIEAKRDSLYKRAKRAEANLKKGSVKKGSIENLLEDLDYD